MLSPSAAPGWCYTEEAMEVLGTTVPIVGEESEAQRLSENRSQHSSITWDFFKRGIFLLRSSS